MPSRKSLAATGTTKTPEVLETYQIIKAVRFVFIAFLLLPLITSCRLSINTHKVSRQYLADCEPGKKSCQPIETSRQNKAEQLFVLFSINALRTSLGLFDSTYLYQIASFKSPDPLRKGFLTKQQRPALDLTGLPDGKFFLHILGDDVGGIFQLNIHTKNQAVHSSSFVKVELTD